VVVDHPMGTAGTAEIVVRNTLTALQGMASWAVEGWGGTVVGVTGSAGKTSTKDTIAALLSVALPVGKNEGNLNNHVGVPLSILRLPDACKVAVLEMGMNHAGEIRELAEIARPKIGVVTNVGYAHVEFFEDGIDGVARAKRELVEALPVDGVAVLNADDDRVAAFAGAHRGRTVLFGLSERAEVRGEKLELGADSSRFTVADEEFELPQAGVHAVSNALAGIAVARIFGIPAKRLRDAVRSLAAGRMRGEKLTTGGVTIWNDCYNSNPEAVKSMIEVLRGTPARRRIAVLGEMLELGRSAEPLHRDIGKYVAARGIDLLIGIRGAARTMTEAAMDAGMSGAAFFFPDPETAGEFLRQTIEEGDAVLFKGSRGVKVEKAMEAALLKLGARG
jgi:UDP-N-acetylmuramoyl-tripeptide--D-alanyl-D-alanine ligase